MVVTQTVMLTSAALLTAGTLAGSKAFGPSTSSADLPQQHQLSTFPRGRH